jgi:hypothetical protein
MLLKPLILSSLILAGCCAPVPKPPQFDSYLLSQCEVVKEEAKFSSWEDVLARKALDKEFFDKCVNKHSGLINSYQNYLKEFNATK